MQPRQISNKTLCHPHDLELLPTSTEGAVAETVRKVNAQALALLSRRVEINRRILSLHRVVHGLRGLATNAASGTYPSTLAAPDRAVWTPSTEQAKDEAGTHASNSSREHTVGRIRSSQSKHDLAVLSRACRIALMEAGGPASLDEIRSRIDRRKSFAFSDSESAGAPLTRTLNRMRDGGEVRCITSGFQSLWRRVAPVSETDSSL